MAHNREYFTGKTKLYKASGSLTLHKCGARSVFSGWDGSNYHHPDGDFQYHYIQGRIGYGPILTIRTGRKPIDGNPAHPGDINPVWVTYITVDSGFDDLALWYNDADSTWDDSHPLLTPPSETITLFFTSTLLCEEWTQEDWGGTLRPQNQNSISRWLRMKPAPGEMVHTTVSFTGQGSPGLGTGHTSFSTIPVISHDVSDPYFGYLSEIDLFFPTNGYAFDISAVYYEPHYLDDPLGHSNDLGYPDVIFAEANTFSFNDPLLWFGTDNNGFIHLDVTHDGSDYGQGFPGGDFKFKAHGPTGLETLQGVGSVPFENHVLSGTVRDFERLIGNVPVKFISGFGPPDPVRNFSGNGHTQIFNGESYSPRLDHDWLISHGYSFTNIEAPVVKAGNSWDSFTLDHYKSLKVVDFTATIWGNTLCTQSIIGSLLVCVATGANPKINRNLINDFNDMANDVVSVNHWWTTYHGEAGFKPGAWDWYNNSAGTLNTNGPGEWVRVGCKLRAGSDIYNWSAYRYAYLTAKADVACNITITITYDDLTFTTDGIGNLAYFRSNRSVSYIVPLTTSLIAHEIDLPSMPDLTLPNELVGQDGLKCISTIEVSFPVGRTISLQDITLKEKERPRVDIHHPYGDAGGITAYESGKHCLVFSSTSGPSRVGTYPSSIWGYPIKQYYPGDAPKVSSMLVSQLVQELNLQEGWFCNLAGGLPDDPSPNYTSWLEEAFNSICPFIAKSKRCYGYLHTYPNSNYPLDFYANIGNEVKGLSFNPITHLPQPTKIRTEIEDFAPAATIALLGPGTELFKGSSDSIGRFTHPIKYVGNDLGVRSNPDTVDQILYPNPVFAGGNYNANPVSNNDRTIWSPALGAVPGTAVGASRAVIDIDMLGNKWVAFLRGNNVTLARWMGIEAGWTYFDTGVVGSDVWIHNNQIEDNNPVYISFTLGSSVYLLKSVDNGERVWSMTTLVNGTNAVIRFNKLHQMLCVSYCRGGNVYFKRFSDAGVTPVKDNAGNTEFLIMAAPAGQYTYDWNHDDSRTITLVYDDGTNILGMISTNNGEVWNPL